MSATEKTGYWFFAPTVGSQMRVRYPSNQPENAIVDSYFHYLIIPMVFILIGGYILFVFQSQEN